MGQDNDEPSRQNYKMTGMVGIILFSTILIINTIAFRNRGMFSSFFIAFYISLSLVCCFEIPNYALIMRAGRNSSQTGYNLHMLASYLFFLCLTLIAHMWSTVIELGPIEKRIFSKISLIAFNVAFLTTVLTAAVFCWTSHSLDGFFESESFFVFTLVELVVGMIFSTCLGVLSVKVVIRFRRHAINASSKPARRGRSESKDANGLSESFKEVMYKVLLSFTSLVVCSLIRLVMLMVQLDNNFMDNLFKGHGSYWFMWIDFVPRCLPCLTLIYLMFYKPVRLHIPSFSRRGSGKCRCSDSVREGESERSTSVRSLSSEVVEVNVESGGDSIANPMRPSSVNYSDHYSANGRHTRISSMRRSDIEVKRSSAVALPSLMTEFYRVQRILKSKWRCVRNSEVTGCGLQLRANGPTGRMSLISCCRFVM